MYHLSDKIKSFLFFKLKHHRIFLTLYLEIKFSSNILNDVVHNANMHPTND
jgi:hypothetical protein